MSDNTTHNKEVANQAAIEAERQEVAQLLGRLLAWDWMEQQRKRPDMSHRDTGNSEDDCGGSES
jgi:hypothetical protein